ncbi:MAG: hypothetical protein MUQ25_10900 [Candidatus Aminicenantes bacterium]|nr:hypothetical protein [Candidatus Aminicenantes bacterium]
MKSKLVLCLMLILAWGLAHNGAFAQEAANALYRTEEITIQAGDFTIVGDFYIPVKGAKHPVAIWVHGSGAATRELIAPILKPQIETFLKAGFAFFVDDIPGAGESKGEIKSAYKDRSYILTKEIEAIKKRDDVIKNQIGIIGTSQAGIVMPLATTMTSDIAFMITECCPAENAYRQEAYLLECLMICDGVPVIEAKKASALHIQRFESENWKEYCDAADTLNKNSLVKLLQMDYGIFDDEDSFKKRNRSTSRPGFFYDPMLVVSNLKFPVLALFGEKDKNVNSVQGVDAYNKALKAAGNKFFQVEMIPNANHVLFETESGCIREIPQQILSGKPNYAPKVLNVLSQWIEKLQKHFAQQQ